MSDSSYDEVVDAALFWSEYYNHAPLSLERTTLSTDEARAMVDKYKERYGSPE